MKVRNVSEVKPEIAHNATWVLRTLFSKNDPLKSDILWINEVIVEPGNAVEPHSHSAAEEIWYIIEGNGVVRIDNEERNVGPGDAIYTPPKHTHTIRNNTKRPLRFTSIGARVRKFGLL